MRTFLKPRFLLSLVWLCIGGCTRGGGLAISEPNKPPVAPMRSDYIPPPTSPEVPLVITCTQRNSSHAIGHNEIAFTQNDCGGVLPDSGYLGAISKMQVGGGWKVFGVLQPQDGPAGTYFWALTATGGYQVSAVFVRSISLASSIISCRKLGDISTGGNTVHYTASDCSGNQLPDASFTGMVSNLNVENGLEEFATLQPINGPPGVYFWASLGGSNLNGHAYTYQISTLFIRQGVSNGIPSVVTCSATGSISSVVSENAAALAFSPSDCGLTPAQFSLLFIDRATHSGAISKLQVANGTIDFYVYNPGESMGSGSAGPGIYFWANNPSGDATYTVSVSYLLDASTLK